MIQVKREATVENTYRQLLVDSRKQQLTMTAEHVQRMAATFDRAADSIIKTVSALPSNRSGTEWTQAKLNLLRSIDNQLMALATDYSAFLDLSMLDVAQAVAEREARTAELVRANPDPRFNAISSRSWTVGESQVSVQFGTMARAAVDAVANRVYRDGLKLSDRLYNLDQVTRQAVEDTLVQGIAEGAASREIGRRMETALSEAGASNPRYQAMRIARTEVNNAHREASVRSVKNEGGSTKSYVLGVRWNLSLSHPMADICDVWAGHDEGLGAGVYSPDGTPLDHPHGLCYVTTELKDFPGIIPPGKRPELDEVPGSQVRYYAEQGDAAALARLPFLESAA